MKWRDFKMVMYLQKTFTDPALKLPNPQLVKPAGAPLDHVPARGARHP